ncbi:hypothetical protein COB21_04305 [Candidatus Aerophobetes bacterium]|uniref:Transporter n=1 Tax=Aerophobetes bacterium TaxID=2030807 RepID=A0A2A4X1E5_UNCAE|nr:MAG: hypothetical protein COB21_04305 [Candidatus Aerophobetes bacterium]
MFLLIRLTRLFLCACVVLSVPLFARPIYDRVKEHPDVSYASWFTGPLLSPTPINMEPGHPAIEPFVTFGSSYGNYDNNWNLQRNGNEWFINPYLDVQFGITNRIGVEFLGSFISNFKQGVSSTRMQDSVILLGFQVANDIKDSWMPDIRVDLQQVFPTGNYRHLDPDNLGVDSTGQGAFQTGTLLIVQKQFYPKMGRISVEASTGCLFAADVKIQGLSAYGGGANTDGKVHPGPTLATFFSVEYSISRQWGCGFDSVYTYQGKSTFDGNTGGPSIVVGFPSSSQFALAPFVEHTFSSNMGILIGSWCTVGGRNARAFASGYFSFLYLF